MAYISAYEIYKVDKYKTIAEEILNSFPHCLIHENLSLYSGIIRLGELYLEAFRVFKLSHWLRRAEWIINVLTHTYREDNNDQIYWLSNNSNYQTADLMKGQTGLIHFLMNYSSSGQLGYPLA
jgi:hypothetical protein